MFALCDIKCQLLLGFPSPFPPPLGELFLTEDLTWLHTSTSILGPVCVTAPCDYRFETANSFTAIFVLWGRAGKTWGTCSGAWVVNPCPLGFLPWMSSLWLSCLQDPDTESANGAHICYSILG